MKQRHEICPLCGLSTTPSNMIRHMKSHENGNFEKRQSIVHVDHEGLNCKYCNKECKNKLSLSQHEIRCNFNIRHIKNTGNLHRNNSERKGLTYAQLNPEKWCATEKLICRYCNSDTNGDNKLFTSLYSLNSHQRLCRYNPVNIAAHPERVSDLEGKLNDDGKLYNKWKLKCSNAKTMGNECYLSFDDYCKLVQDAGLMSSQLGISGESYELARYGDKGPYSIDNCRFITHQENMQEREVSNKMIESVLRSAVMRKGKKRVLSEEGRKSLEEYRKKIHEEHEIREQERKSKLDPRWCGEHNSSYGSHWITNGVESRKWRPNKEPKIPEGWHLGRVVKSNT